MAAGGRELGSCTRRTFLLGSTAALGGWSAASAEAGRAASQLATGDTERGATNASGHVTLFLSGDVMTARGIDQVLPHPGDPELRERVAHSALDYVALAKWKNGRIPRPVDFAYCWGAALDELERAAPDARIINLETSVTRSSDFARKSIHYRMHPENVGVLTAAGIDCCVLANNHVLDLGRAGLVETLDVLQGAGLATVGAGRDRAEAEAPAILDLGEGRRVLVFAFGSITSGIPRGWGATADRPGVSVLEARRVDDIAARIRAVRRPGDVVIASIHWGGNWGYEVPREQVDLARALVAEAGVDVVHGHSSHHFKAIEVHRGKPILYGCGDFLNDYEGIEGYEGFRSELVLMYLVTLEVATGSLERLELVPLRIARMRLERPSPEDARWVRERLDRECGRFGARVEPNAAGALELAWSP